jgi:hypothetical protein
LVENCVVSLGSSNPNGRHAKPAAVKVDEINCHSAHGGNGCYGPMRSKLAFEFARGSWIDALHGSVSKWGFLMPDYSRERVGFCLDITRASTWS